MTYNDLVTELTSEFDFVYFDGVSVFIADSELYPDAFEDKTDKISDENVEQVIETFKDSMRYQFCCGTIEGVPVVEICCSGDPDDALLGSEGFLDTDPAEMLEDIVEIVEEYF